MLVYSPAMRTGFAFFALLMGLSSLTLKALGADALPPFTARMALVVAWEGSSVDPANVEALEKLRPAVDGVRWVHLLDAALWVRDGADEKSVRKMLKSTVRKGDVTGIHLAAWKSVVEKAGVSHRRKPTFWGNQLSADECARDCGREVPLASYSSADVAKIVKKAVSIVEAGGVDRPAAFMIGGHGGDRKLLDAASAAGLKVDFSGVIPAQVGTAFMGNPLWAWVSESWSGARLDVNGLSVETASGPIKRYVVNVGQADWHSGDEMARLAEDIVAEARRNKLNGADIVFLMHGDTAARTAPRMAQAFKVLSAWWVGANVMPVSLELN